MMLPLWTMVTLRRPWSIANRMALRTSRLVPNGLIGLRPTPASSRIFHLNSRPTYSINRFASGEPLAHSYPT